MNTKLLRRIQKQILLKPYQFEMTAWFVDNSRLKEKGEKVTKAYNGKPIPNCGTAGCIAGWALTLGLKFKKLRNAIVKFKKSIGEVYTELEHDINKKIADKAQELLKLDTKQANRLFYVDNWPNKFVAGIDKWNAFSALSKEEQAQVASDRIDHFINTAGE